MKRPAASLAAAPVLVVAALLLLCALMSRPHGGQQQQALSLTRSSASSSRKVGGGGAAATAGSESPALSDPDAIVEFIRAHNQGGPDPGARMQQQQQPNEDGGNGAPIRCESCWTLVQDLAHAPPATVDVHLLEHTANFSRPAPKSLDPNLLPENAKAFNLLQDISADPASATPFQCPHDSLYVAEIQDCFVEGVSGLMWDVHGNLYGDDTHFFTRADRVPSPMEEAMPVRKFSKLVSVVQRYSNMYYHFSVEILPRIVAAKAYLEQDPSAKLLVWDEPFIIKYLQAVGIARDRVEAFDPFVRYFADVVVYPYPSPRITPCKESLAASRAALGVETLEDTQRDLILYVSREGEMNRRVSNEDELLRALEQAFPEETIVKYSSVSDVDSIVALFQRAKMVVGPHGAGFSHILFTAPGTKVVELHFLKDPPMMFWHMAGALDLDYWIVPVPKSHWTIREMDAPIEEVVAVVALALGYEDKSAASSDSSAAAAAAAAAAAPLSMGCSAGSVPVVADGAVECQACPPGTFKALRSDPFCSPCSPGQTSPSGSSYCTMCPLHHYQTGNNTCDKCPEGLTTWTPGSSSVDDCITKEKQGELLESIVSQMVESGFLFKLDPDQRHLHQPMQRSLIMYDVYAGVSP